MKRILFLITICIMALATLTNCSSKKSMEIEENYSAPSEEKVRISNLISNGNFPLALHKSDSLIKIFPNDPQIHILKGFAYYNTGDSAREKDAFMQAIRIYDLLLSQRPDFSNEINKAMCILFVEGDKAYQEYLNKVERMEEYKESKPLDTKSIPMFRDAKPEKIIRDAFSE